MTSAPRFARISLGFLSYWCAGTGGGRGRHLDAVCHRDAGGFPAMPMSEVKGTLREVAEWLAADKVAGWTPGLVNTLFGKRTEDGGQGAGAALEFIGDAQMSSADKAIDDLAANTAILFRRIAATKINDAGVAEDKTLRFTECAVPVRIEGLIKWQANKESPANWVELLDAAAAATLAFGKIKNDGNGRAIAEVSALTPATAATDNLDPALLSAHKVVLVLRQARPAIFNERAATETGHRTLPAPTGAALLGWCAAQGTYADFDDTHGIFHSGAVKFGDTVPVLADGTLSVAFPRNLFAPKEKKAVDAAGKLNPDLIHVGPPPSNNNDKIQYEALKQPFLANNDSTVTPQKGQRLRTATTNGRAAKGQLFGYQHLSADGHPVFAAVIERDGSVCQADWERLLRAFCGRTLSLGRSKSTGYGGGFACSVQLPDEKGAFGTLQHPRRVRVLALSDLALVDDRGCPTSHPVAGMFGLPISLTFDARDSVISQRRFSPWNSKLRSRDLERQLIEAGSVISFKVPDGVAKNVNSGRKCIGVWREAGFGQIWINPDFLSGDELTGSLKAGRVVLNSHTGGDEDPHDLQTEVDENLSAWLRAQLSETQAQGAAE